MSGSERPRQPYVAAPPEVDPGANGHHPSPTLRRDIVVLLRQLGPSSPDQLAVRLGASRTGVLQQLRALETAQLVMRRTERHGVGRPRHLYDVTPDAQDLFPSNYDGLAASLLAAILAVGGDDLVEEVFAARRRQASGRMRERLADRLPSDASLDDRLREVAAIQDEQGYLAQVEVDHEGTFRLVEHNCAIFQIASSDERACQAELELFSEVLGAEVVRDSHIATGDRCCSYRVVDRQG